MKEFEKLSVEQLDELHAALGKCVDILNPEELKLTELCMMGKDLTLQLTMFMIEVFNEQRRRFNQ